MNTIDLVSSISITTPCNRAAAGVQNMLASPISNTQEAAGILRKYIDREIDKVVKAGIFVDGNGFAKIVNLKD